MGDIYFIIYIHLPECFSSGIQTPHRQEIRNEPNKSFRHSWIRKPSQWESVEGLTPPHYAHIYCLNAAYGQKAYTMWVSAHFSKALSPFVPHLFCNFKRFCTAPPPNSSRRFLIPPSENIWVGVHQRTNARWHVFIGMNTDCWRGYFTLSS